MSSVPILYAPNVHTGGGLVLLKSVLESWDRDQPLRAFLDERAKSLLFRPPGAQTRWVAPRILERLAAQRQLSSESHESTTIICFNGLPPLLPIRGCVVVFLQNRLHFSAPSFREYGFKVGVRLAFERLVFRAFRHRVSRYVLQTPSMARALTQWYGSHSLKMPNVSILPFVPAFQAFTLTDKPPGVPDWDFLYVADGLPHKNHIKLLDAWCILAKEGLKPRLALTLPSSEKYLCELISHLCSSVGVDVINLGHLSHDKMLDTYKKAGALIYPSLKESFGLPLCEARQSNLPIVASELDYVRDVCEPVETFDPVSEVSIARAVRRFIGVPEAISTLSEPDEFWRTVLQNISD